jgi:hypothetical protein
MNKVFCRTLLRTVAKQSINKCIPLVVRPSFIDRAAYSKFRKKSKKKSEVVQPESTANLLSKEEIDDSIHNILEAELKYNGEQGKVVKQQEEVANYGHETHLWIKRFRKLDLSDQLAKSAVLNLGWQQPTEIQRHVIPMALKRHNVSSRFVVLIRYRLLPAQKLVLEKQQLMDLQFCNA